MRFATQFVIGVSLISTLALGGSDALAQKKGGGSTSSGGNATVVLDAITNTLSVTGDSASNLILIDLRDGWASISGVGKTKINGSTSSLTVTFDPEGFLLILDGRAGTDDLWVNVNAVETACGLMINGGDGGDRIAVSTPNGPSRLAGLDVAAGAGDDLTSVAVNGVLAIEGPLNVSAGDGSDRVEVGPSVLIEGAATLDGGKRQDQITLSEDLVLQAALTAFESILFW